MIIEIRENKNLYYGLDKIGLRQEINKHKYVLIKINLARPAEVGHPRTDPYLLSEIIKYISLNNGICAICESANGYLAKNLDILGLQDVIREHKVEVIDLDFEGTDRVTVDSEEHYIPKCFQKYGVRIAMPAASKRSNMIFSNNVKLFVGAVPRKFYQLEGRTVDWRPRIHLDLHKSVANIYRAIQLYSPFNFFINGGLAMDETIGEIELDRIFIGNDAVKLDLHVLKNVFINHEIPDYIRQLQESGNGVV